MIFKQKILKFLYKKLLHFLRVLESKKDDCGAVFCSFDFYILNKTIIELVVW